MRTIVILTVAPFDTLGDVSAASKLIQEMQQMDPQLQFCWFVKRTQSPNLDISAYRPSERCTTNVIDNWNEVLDSEQHKSTFRNASEVIAFPTFHWLSDDIKTFIYSLSIPFVAVTEYDYEFKFPAVDRISPVKAPIIFHSGLAKDCLGIFIDRPTNPSSLDQIDISDFSFSHLLMRHCDAHSYFKDHQLFFGYFNKDGNDVDSSCEVTPLEFIKSALFKANHQAPEKCHIDIVIRLEEPSFEKIIQQLRRENLIDQDTVVEFWKKTNGQMSKSFTTSDPANEATAATKSAKQKTVRIINPFRLHPQTFSTILKLSDPFCAVTGDQSFSEGIYKFFFYQMMKWKVNLFASYLGVIKQVLGRESLLYRFYSIQNTESEDTLTTRLKTLVGDCPGQAFTQLEREAHEVAQYILANRNLRTKLPQLLIALMKESLELPIEINFLNQDSLAKIKYDLNFYDMLYNYCLKKNHIKNEFFIPVIKQHLFLNYNDFFEKNLKEEKTFFTLLYKTKKLSSYHLELKSKNLDLNLLQQKMYPKIS